MSTETMTPTAPKKRGFASMTLEERRRIASLGGRAAHKKGTAHEWGAKEAAEAGRKGGLASRGGKGKLKTFDQVLEEEARNEQAEVA